MCLIKYDINEFHNIEFLSFVSIKMKTTTGYKKKGSLLATTSFC